MSQLVAVATDFSERDMEKGKRIQGKAVVTGADLIKALGFNNARAFQRARQLGRLTVPLYPIPGQARGVYALLEDVKAFQRATAAATRKRPSPPEPDCSS
jgi:hypothetical protein